MPSRQDASGQQATRRPVAPVRRVAPILFAFAFAAGLAQGARQTAAAEPVHAIAMHGLPKHPPGFSHFPYVNPDAPRGGRLVLGQQGTFDSLNPFVVKGRAASGLRNYVYESLLARSGDEPFTLYGLIAESIEVPPDRSFATFHLRPEARFADGQPVTPDDVLFSHAFLKDKGYPYHREHYRKVAAAEKVGERSVRFVFNAAGDREMPLILGLMPILPRHKFDGEPTLEPPLGSGAYRVAHVDPGRSVVYRRNPDWWARDLPVARGRFNFDEVRIEYYRDEASLFDEMDRRDRRRFLALLRERLMGLDPAQLHFRVKIVYAGGTRST